MRFAATLSCSVLLALVPVSSAVAQDSTVGKERDKTLLQEKDNLLRQFRGKVVKWKATIQRIGPGGLNVLYEDGKLLADYQEMCLKHASMAEGIADKLLREKHSLAIDFLMTTVFRDLHGCMMAFGSLASRLDRQNLLGTLGKELLASAKELQEIMVPHEGLVFRTMLEADTLELSRELCECQPVISSEKPQTRAPTK